MSRDLSARELEVLRLVADGLEYAQVAERLCLSHRTVRTHMLRIMAALGVHNRVAAAVWLVRQEQAK